jgi:hypothetical protein
VNSKLTAELGRKGTEAPRKVRDCVLQLLQSDRVQNGNCMSRRTRLARRKRTDMLGCAMKASYEAEGGDSSRKSIYRYIPTISIVAW